MEWTAVQITGWDCYFGTSPGDALNPAIVQATRDAITAGAKPGRQMKTQVNKAMRAVLLEEFEKTDMAAWIAKCPPESVSFKPLYRARMLASGTHITASVDIMFTDKSLAAKFKIQFVGI